MVTHRNIRPNYGVTANRGARLAMRAAASRIGETRLRIDAKTRRSTRRIHGIAFCMRGLENASDRVACEQGQVRGNVRMRRQFFVFLEENFLHCCNCGMCFASQEFYGPLLLSEDLRVS